MVQIGQEDWLTTAEAAKHSKVTREYMGYLAHKGALRVMRIGDRYLVAADSLQQYIENRPRRGRPRLRTS